MMKLMEEFAFIINWKLHNIMMLQVNLTTEDFF